MALPNVRLLRSVTGRSLGTAAVLLLAVQTTSCVPLLIGGAVGYIARDQGVGVVEPVGGGSDTTYGYDTAPGYGDGPAYDYSGPEFTDEPVY